MKKNLLIFISILILIACDKNNIEVEDYCKELNQPIEKLSWLSEKVEELNGTDFGRKYFHIYQAEYNGNVVFIESNCCHVCSTVSPVYNCQGQQIGLYASGDIEPGDLKNLHVLWQAAESECVFTTTD